MTDYLLTILILGLLAVIFFFSININKDTEFMGLSYTNAIKAVACVIVVFVHIPAEHGNAIQDMIGSFAYVGVFCFFMISAYGCRSGIEKNREYLTTFWKKRLLALLIPVLVLNIFNFICSQAVFGTCSIQIDRYIYALAIAYFIFWAVWKMRFVPEKYKDTVIFVVILLGSLVTYFTDYDVFFIWPVECIGFAVGLIIFNALDKIKVLLEKRLLRNVAAFGVLSLIIGVLYIKVKPVWFWGGYVVKIFLAVALLMFVFSITYRMSIKKNSLLLKLGSISFEVYLVHALVIGYIKKLLPNLSSGEFIVVVFFVSIVMAIIIKKIANQLMQAIKNISK